MPAELITDIAIIGGGIGGCAAALAAARMGARVILTEESDWVGGQFTSQATPPDEHGWIEQFGCTKSYRRLRNEVRQHYKMVYPLTPQAQARPFFNPGDGWVSPLCAEPLVWLTIIEASLTKYVGQGKLQILINHRPIAADTSGDEIRAVTVQDIITGNEVAITAKYFLDATELGDLLHYSGTESVSGSESRRETGEPSASEIAREDNSQALSVCFALSYFKEADNTITKPKKYDFWRGYVPALQPPWSGRLLSLDGLSPRTLAPVSYKLAPHQEPIQAFAGLWTYRRILNRDNFVAGAFESDITIVNFPQIDYLLGDLVTSDYSERAQMIAEAKQLSLSFLYYLQTEHGLPGLLLRGDVVGTADGLAKMPYIRESRRIRALFTVKEQHLSASLRPGANSAEKFRDSVGIGSYRIDLHPTSGGDNYLDVAALPFQIPLGSLLPQRVENLLPAAKNIGTTHITNGCYRLHPVEWNIGEASGALAAFCLGKGIPPRQVYLKQEVLQEFQDSLVKQGVELDWPENLVLEEGDPHRHAG